MKIGVGITTFNKQDYYDTLYNSLPLSEIDSLIIEKEFEVRKKLKQAKNNPSEIDKILEDELGINEHG